MLLPRVLLHLAWVGALARLGQLVDPAAAEDRYQAGSGLCTDPPCLFLAHTAVVCAHGGLSGRSQEMDVTPATRHVNVRLATHDPHRRTIRHKPRRATHSSTNPRAAARRPRRSVRR